MNEEFEKHLFDAQMHSRWFPFSVEDSKILLSTNRHLVQEMFPTKAVSKSNTSKDALQVKHFPIQRCDIKPINMAADQSQFKNVPMHSDWAEATVNQLLLLQNNYGKIREELLYGNIQQWNAIRTSFCHHGEVIPFQNASLYDMDLSLQKSTERSDKALQLTLMKGISCIMKEPVPAEWIELIQEMIITATHQNYHLSAKQQELLYSFQMKKNSIEAIIEKKRLCLETDLSLPQVNQWLQSQSTGIGLVSVNQTSFADGINGILEADAIGGKNHHQVLPDMNYLSQIFGGFGSQDLQFNTF